MKKHVLPLLFVLCLAQTQSRAAADRYQRLYEKSGGRIKVYYDSIVDNQLKGGTVIQTLPHPQEARLDATDAATWNVTTIVNNGPSSNRVDWVIIGDGYTEAELDDYAADADRIVSGWFATEPFDIYANYFNVHRVDVVSNESGIDDLNADPPVYKDTALDMYRQEHIIYLGDRDAAEAAAACAPACDIILALANTDWYGGTGAAGLAVASSDNDLALELVLHEMGHSFGYLADEYYSSGTTYTDPEPTAANVSIYQAAEQIAEQRKWYRWLDLPHVDTFEGAYYNEFGIYRPTEQSTMNWLENPFYEVNIEQLIFRIYQDVSPIDDATANDLVQTEGTTFFATAVQPVGYDLSFQWALDCNDLSGAINSEFEPDYESLEAGMHEVSVTITDNTPKVRDESKRNELLRATRRWELAVMTPKGIMEIAPKYCTTNDNLHLRLLDEDLKGNGFEYLSISTTAGDSETILLTEQPPDSGVFEANVNTVHGASVAGDGILNVTVGEVITADYVDLDDGTGRSRSLSDKSLVYSALFNPSVSNASFESQQLDTWQWSYRIDDWIINLLGQVYLEGGGWYATPYGGSDAKMWPGAYIWQQIGGFTPSTQYKVTIWLGGEHESVSTQLSLWAGGDTSLLPVDYGQIDSTVGAAQIATASAVPGDWSQGEDVAVLLTTPNSGYSNTDALWLAIKSTCDSGQAVWVDNIRVELVDISAPLPNPTYWKVAPYGTATDSITMVAETALDQSGVEYLFECVSGDGHNSTWQDSCVYTDTGLSFLDTLTYRVKTRDKSASKNESQYSDLLSAVATYLADVDTNGSVDIRDFSDISYHWMRTDCDGLSRCNRTDLNADSFVDLIDLTILLEDWLSSNNI